MLLEGESHAAHVRAGGAVWRHLWFLLDMFASLNSQAISHTTRLLCAQVVQVAAGGMHSVALTAEGEVYTCGVNDEGALGRETSECISAFI